MAGKSEGATNERIVRLLEEVKGELAESKKREQQICPRPRAAGEPVGFRNSIAA